MSCHQTPEIVADYFDQQLSPQARQALQQHLSDCQHCRAEIALLEPARGMLLSWQQQSVPDWDRGHGPALHNHRQPLRKRPSRAAWRDVGRWIPLAASLILSVAVLTQTRLDVSEQGWQLSFGNSAAERQLAQLDVYLAEQARIQRQQNQALLQTALQEFGDSTADNLYQLADWFEQQRELDIRRMEAGFQQMLDRDYQTVNSVQQLASFVQYQNEQP
ncbi:MAG: zf-HC2 domain-containing protein [Pseudohongiella sp.]|uniref:anti-sigma factor n=1 Tax=Pseudohongiella sp. TaxID=1979412 RepID=UPI00349FD268